MWCIYGIIYNVLFAYYFFWQILCGYNIINKLMEEQKSNIIITELINGIMGDDTDIKHIQNFTNDKSFSTCAENNRHAKKIYVVIETNDEHYERHAEFAKCMTHKEHSRALIICNTSSRQENTEKIEHIEKKDLDKQIGKICMNGKKEIKIVKPADLYNKLENCLKSKKQHFSVMTHQQQTRQRQKLTHAMRQNVHMSTSIKRGHIEYNIANIDITDYNMWHKFSPTRGVNENNDNLSDTFSINVSPLFSFREFNKLCKFGSHGKNQVSRSEIFSQDSEKTDFIMSYTRHYIKYKDNSILLISHQEYIKISTYYMTNPGKIHNFQIKDKFNKILFPAPHGDIKSSDECDGNELVAQFILARNISILEYFKIFLYVTPSAITVNKPMVSQLVELKSKPKKAKIVTKAKIDETKDVANKKNIFVKLVEHISIKYSSYFYNVAMYDLFFNDGVSDAEGLYKKLFDNDMFGVGEFRDFIYLFDDDIAEIIHDYLKKYEKSKIKS